MDIEKFKDVDKNNTKPIDLPEEKDSELVQKTIHFKDIESTSVKQDTNAHDIDIIAEMQNINQQLSTQNYQSYKKSTYWHQQNANQVNVQQMALLQELIDSLARIENILKSIVIQMEK